MASRSPRSPRCERFVPRAAGAGHAGPARRDGRPRALRGVAALLSGRERRRGQARSDHRRLCDAARARPGQVQPARALPRRALGDRVPLPRRRPPDPRALRGAATRGLVAHHEEEPRRGGVRRAARRSRPSARSAPRCTGAGDDLHPARRPRAPRREGAGPGGPAHARRRSARCARRGRGHLRRARVGLPREGRRHLPRDDQLGPPRHARRRRVPALR